MSSQIEQKGEPQNKSQLPPRKKGGKRPSLLSVCWSVFIIFLIFLGIWLKIVIPPPQSNVYTGHVDWATLGVNERIPKNVKEDNEADSRKRLQAVPLRNRRQDEISTDQETMPKFLKQQSLDDKFPPASESELDAIKNDAQQAQILSTENAITLSQPGLCLILSGVGLKTEYDQVIESRLVPEINIAVLPFKPSVTDKVKAWTQSTHEVIAEIPMESMNYPEEDVGENSLLTGLSPSENISRLEGFLARTPGVRGVLSLNGTRFTAVRRDITPIIQYLKSKNLLFVDSVATARSQADEVSALLKSPFMAVTVTIPVETDSDAAWKIILAEAEKSLKHGLSVVKVDVSPKRLNDLIEWQDKLKQAGMRLYKLSEATDLLKMKDENRAKSSPDPATIDFHDPVPAVEEPKVELPSVPLKGGEK